jgi:hypothetical protein
MLFQFRMGYDLVIARFVSPLLSFIEGLFPFPYADISTPFFGKSRAKIIYFSTYKLPNFFARCVYACCSTISHVYRDLCQKIQNEVGFPCHNK